MHERLKHFPAMWETWVRSLDRKDPLEKERATYSNILAWRIPWTEQLGGLQSMGSQRVRHDWETTFTFTFFILLLEDLICRTHVQVGKLKICSLEIKQNKTKDLLFGGNAPQTLQLFDILKCITNRMASIIWDSNIYHSILLGILQWNHFLVIINHNTLQVNSGGLSRTQNVFL